MAGAKLIVGNWKMHGLSGAAGEIDAIIAGLPETTANAIVCPPFTLVAAFAARTAGTPLRIGAQDVHPGAMGAHTGDIAAAMLVDAGAVAVIVGHSERRAGHAETDAIVRAKTAAAVAAGLMAIVCVGETAAERRAGEAVAVVERQLAGSLPAGGDYAVAYEPVWAIGSGLTPTAAEIAAMHAAIRAVVGPRPRILYGGSVKPGNAAELLAIADVDGALVGGASLAARDFLAIVGASPPA